MKKLAGPIGLVAAWVLIFCAFSVLQPETFPTVRNIETIVRQTVIVGFAAIGMTYVVMTGAIDLSVGSLVALATVVTAMVLNIPMDPLLAAVVCVGAGALAGLFNGILVTKLRIGSFIVTLATLLAMRGLAKGLANEQTVKAPDTWLSGLTAALAPGQKWMLLPAGGWMLLACAAAAAWAMKHTVFGRHVAATGSSEATAKMCGVNTSSVQIWAFVLAGACAGLAGLMQFARLTVGDPTVASGLELSVIAAVVIGGASLNGGEGSIFGSLAGAIIMTTIAAGGAQMGWPNWIQEIVTGAIIIGAVGLDRWRAARAAQGQQTI